MRGAFDFECDDWVKPVCVCFISQDGQRHAIHDTTYKNPELVAVAALKYMLTRTDVTEWWAHNAGKYDGLFLSAAAKKLGWRQSGAIAGGNRIITWRFTPPGAYGSVNSVCICDSFAVLQSKLADIAKDFDLPSKKQFTEEDYKTSPSTWGTEKLLRGCFADCQIVLEALDKVETLIEDWGGQLKHTFSSSAMSVVKAHLEESGIPLPKGVTPSVNESCRRGYYGARVEVFSHAPPFELSEYDINSSYPYAMTQTLPWHYAGSVFGKEAERAYEKGHAGIYEARVIVPRSTYLPPLPRISEHGGIFFPTGAWEAYFPACELHYAQLCGCQVRILSGEVFSKGEPFKDYVDRVFEVKRTAKGALRQFAKLLLNGSYGKFGEKPEKQELRIFSTEEEAIDYVHQHEGKVTQLGEDATICSVDVFRWPSHTHYAMAAYITAYARMHLHRLLTAAESPAYCDSDSVHCKVNGIPEHECNELLGGLKVEIRKGVGKYYAPKIYEIRDLEVTKCKNEQCKQCKDGPTQHLHIACKGFPVEETSFRKLVLGESVAKGRMQLAKGQLRRGGLTVARVVDNKRWLGMSSKRRAINAVETIPWTVEEIQNGEHLKQKSPLADWKQIQGELF